MILREDLIAIEKWLQHRSVKDTDFKELLDITGNEDVILVKNDKNVKMKLHSLVDYLLDKIPNDSDTVYNIETNTEKQGIELKDAIVKVPLKLRKTGLIITYKDKSIGWNIVQFTGVSVEQWSSVSLWRPIIQSQGTNNLNMVYSTIPDSDEKMVIGYTIPSYTDTVDFTSLPSSYLVSNDYINLFYHPMITRYVSNKLVSERNYNTTVYATQTAVTSLTSDINAIYTRISDIESRISNLENKG